MNTALGRLLMLVCAVIALAGPLAAQSVGPDVIVGNLPNVSRYGTVNGVTAYAVGTDSCNIGDAPADWFELTNRHPVIAQHMYRYKLVNGTGRFEQIGISWVKHGFFVEPLDLCSPGQCRPVNSQQLGPGCSDVYNSGLNGFQTSLGPRSEINAATGVFPFPPVLNPAIPQTIGRRLQVRDADLDAAQNPGALYFFEGQYVTPDDTAAGNGLNNVSHRRVLVGAAPFFFTSWPAGESTIRQQPAITAWKAIDPAVRLSIIDVPGDGRIYVGSRVYSLGGAAGAARYRYEYAVYNMTSDRSIGDVSLSAPACAAITATGFGDIFYHSGEPYSGDDWTVAITGGGAAPVNIRWASPQTFAQNQNANAIRWGTLYTFRFDSDVPPAPGGSTMQLGLFKPGTPATVTAAIEGPGASCACPADCDRSGVVDINDFFCFLTQFANNDPRADFDLSGGVDVNDFFAFLTAYAAGC